jgi:hypothetical protein
MCLDDTTRCYYLHAFTENCITISVKRSISNNCTWEQLKEELCEEYGDFRLVVQMFYPESKIDMGPRRYNYILRDGDHVCISNRDEWKKLRSRGEMVPGIDRLH